MTTHSTSLVTDALTHWWTLDLANASASPGVISREELVPSPRAYARNGSSRRWLGDYKIITNMYIYNVKLYV
jgi:hypothetical protein